jgi:hypothetical protein
MNRSGRIATVGLLLCGTLTLAATSPAAPQMNLKVSTHSGKVPLDLTLAGEVSGITAALASTCLVQTTYHFITLSGQPVDWRKTLPCEGTHDAEKATLSFKKRVELPDIGTYTYRILLQPEGARQMAGMEQEVKVYHSVELGASAGKGSN